MNVLFNCDGPFGKITDETDDAYHAKRALSVSKLKDFVDGPLFFYQKHIERSVPDEDTDGRREGRLFHSLMRFGRERFAAEFPVVPDFGDCRFSANKAKRDAWRAEHPNWETNEVDADTNRMLMRMFDSVMSHKIARDLVTAEGAECEVSWRARSENLPFAVQCRTDLINFKGCVTSQRRPFVVDYKSIRNLTRGGDYRRIWENEYVDRRYFLQDPFYLSVLDLAGLKDDFEFYYVVTEKNPPHATAVFSSDEIARGTGRRVIRDKINELAECLENNKWPSTAEEVLTCTIPEWQLNRAFRQPTTRT